MSLAEIRSKIRSACADAKREPDTVTLVAVSKTRPEEKIRALLAEGQRVFGENRVQEAAEKFPALRTEYKDIELHLVGHLQTNKAREAVRIFDVIESLDSERLAEELDREMKKQDRFLPCFIQVNTGDEPQKDGVAPAGLGALLGFCAKKTALDIRGLMCIPPVDEVPDLHFALLRKLAREHSLENLSMGMSADFETAIRYGATHVRVGSALFCPRES